MLSKEELIPLLRSVLSLWVGYCQITVLFGQTLATTLHINLTLHKLSAFLTKEHFSMPF